MSPRDGGFASIVFVLEHFGQEHKNQRGDMIPVATIYAGVKKEPVEGLPLFRRASDPLTRIGSKVVELRILRGIQGTDKALRCSKKPIGQPVSPAFST